MERAPVLLLPKLDNQLIPNFQMEGFGGRAPKHELCGERHRCLERGKLLDHLDVARGSDLHSL
jgi:hypothetical protein